MNNDCQNLALSEVQLVHVKVTCQELENWQANPSLNSELSFCQFTCGIEF